MGLGTYRNGNGINDIVKYGIEWIQRCQVVVEIGILGWYAFVSIVHTSDRDEW